MVEAAKREGREHSESEVSLGHWLCCVSANEAYVGRRFLSYVLRTRT